MSWTINSTGKSDGPSNDNHKPDGQIDFVPDFKNARQDVPYEHNFHKLSDVNPAPDRVELPDPRLNGIPDPGCGDPGQSVSFGEVAPDTDDGVMYDLDGKQSGGDGGFALGANRPD